MPLLQCCCWHPLTSSKYAEARLEQSWEEAREAKRRCAPEQAPANLSGVTPYHMSHLGGSDGSSCCLALATLKPGLHVEPADGALDVLLVVVSAAPRYKP